MSDQAPAIQWLSQAEAAKRLGVSWVTVHRRIKAGVLAYTVDPATGYPRIAAADLDAYLTEGYRPARYSRQRTPRGSEVAA